MIFQIDTMKKTIRAIIDKNDQDAVRAAAERHGYTFVWMKKSRLLLED